MQEKTNSLEEAVRKQADSLDPAQREFMLAEFRNYQWNAAEIVRIEKEVESGAYEDHVAEKRALGIRHQLVNENASLSTHIMGWLRGTAAGENKLDAFISS